MKAYFWYALLVLRVASGTGSSIAISAEERKAEFRQLVLSNYGQPVTLGSCGALKGPSANDVLPPETCSGQDVIGSRNFDGTNFVEGRNGGIAVLAYEKQPVPSFPIEMLKCLALTEAVDSSASDFDLTILLRVLFLLDRNLAMAQELEAFIQERYDNGYLRLWLTADEKRNYYWTENHMLLYLSATLLLRDRINLRPTDDAVIHVDARIRHYLNIKIEYGFYEWFSTIYLPPTLCGLLNLIDFCSDAEVVALAITATKRLLSDWLRFTTASGYYFPVAARNIVHRYDPSFRSITYILTGQGPPLVDGSWRAEHWGQFLATSVFDFDAAVVGEWDLVIDDEFSVGHRISDHKQIHAGLSRLDRTMFQWSAGAIANPEVVEDSLYFLREYRPPVADFGSVPFLQFLLNVFPSFLAPIFASIFSGQSMGTDFSGANYYVYKHYDSMLSSLKGFNVGRRGAQQYPWMATAHDVAVFTLSGMDDNCFRNNGQIANTHLPDVKQSHNVALITYKPSWDVKKPFDWLESQIGLSLRVGLYFPTYRFDEVVERGRWVIGRRIDSYVAVWRHDTKLKGCEPGEMICDEYWYSDGDDRNKASAWAVVVGNSVTHGSFSDFVAIVEQGAVEEEVPWPFLDLFIKYTSKVRVDGQEITSSL